MMPDAAIMLVGARANRVSTVAKLAAIAEGRIRALQCPVQTGDDQSAG
jgi:hypothetical protein